MKFYRVSYSQEGGNSGGYSWHTSRTEALRKAREAQRDAPEEYDYGSRGGVSLNDMIDELTLAPTKADILRVLNAYASHPDNG